MKMMCDSMLLTVSTLTVIGEQFLLFIIMHSPWIADTDTRVDAGIDSRVGDWTWVGCSVGLSYGLTADPFGLIHHCACMRETTHIPHSHQQVVPRFEDVNRLIVGDGDKALTVHFQDLVTHLSRQLKLSKQKHCMLIIPRQTNCRHNFLEFWMTTRRRINIIQSHVWSTVGWHMVLSANWYKMWWRGRGASCWCLGGCLTCKPTIPAFKKL